MKCPNCQNRKIDVYEARGYTSRESPIKECECGHVWRLIPLGEGKHRLDIIKQGKKIDIPTINEHLSSKERCCQEE
jgi:hypothetical protein